MADTDSIYDVTHSPPVEYQYELALLNEECGEFVQIVGKVLRFGWMSSSPLDPTRTNLELLHLELGDILAATEFAIERGLLDRDKLALYRDRKLAKLARLSRAGTQPPGST